MNPFLAVLLWIGSAIVLIVLFYFCIRAARKSNAD
jgi:hypothetical protein